MRKKHSATDPGDDSDNLDDDPDDDTDDAVRRDLDRWLNRTAIGRTYNAAASIVGLTLSILWHAVVCSPLLFFLYLVFRFSR